MTAKEIVTSDDLEYAIRIRREIHEHPELGFDLPNTASVVKRELERMGIDWTDRYAECSVSGYIGNGEKTIGIRADMDALPVEEKTGLPYASKIPGKMHACGHDAHTAVLLAVARILKRNEKQLPVRVKLLFQPSEEDTRGAKTMLDNGAADDVNAMICAHCENALPSGRIGCRSGDHMAASDPITITFHGKTAHAARAEAGIDAIAMAYDAVGSMKRIAAELAGDRMHVFHVCYFHGGTAYNVVADTCTLQLSFRYYDMDMAEQIRNACISSCERIAETYGGTVDIDWQMSAPALHNDEALVASFRASMSGIFADGWTEIDILKSTEDFAWFLTRCPGFLFRFGTRNEEKGCTGTQHCNDFNPDENAMLYPILAFVEFCLNGKL